VKRGWIVVDMPVAHQKDVIEILKSKKQKEVHTLQWVG